MASIEVICPSCGHIDETKLSTWDVNEYFPYVCSKCREFNWIKRNKDACETSNVIWHKSSEQISNIRLGAHVYVNNRDHELFLERGTIEGKDHAHCRVKFISTDKRINEKRLWVPNAWLCKVPDELK